MVNKGKAGKPSSGHKNGRDQRKNPKGKNKFPGMRKERPKPKDDMDVDNEPWKKVPVRKGKPLFNPPPVPKDVLDKYTRGERLPQQEIASFRSKTLKKKALRAEKKIQWAEETTARAEVLLTEESGFLQTDEGEVSKYLTQKQIVANVDITSATKYFNLDLDFGPYRVDYTRNGRHLLIGGRRGHVAAFDWVTKRLHCEINVMEEVKDVQWLHLETMFATAQKNWVHVYDNCGVELHCLKQLQKVLRLAFLPHHFLLVSSSENSQLTWLDVSMGEIIKSTALKKGPLNVMAHNPYNGVVCLGHLNGTVSMWSPNQKKSLVSMLCHKAPVETLAIDSAGKYMATTSVNQELRVWDIRMLDGPLGKYRLRGNPVDTSFSQRGCVALAFNNVVEVYKQWNLGSYKKGAYIVHETLGNVSSLEFCPYEDILGIGTKKGFVSIIVPGAGEPNFDALEANPMQTKSQRREAEVKSLLDKVQPEMIVLEPSKLLEVNVPGLQDRIRAKVEILAAVKELSAIQKKILAESASEEKKKPQASGGALDRFLPKQKR
ncbi:unnamed protein product [Nesidiocoris tenuis]|uniref:BING4 C-terminal domain-containing protein n=1 Tax=Nesidiocoris tenuis TaxID=355587 RepID=A0A6H5G687_9HEMI|nr:unnamed protein product [Nesidiocoris tenuis]